MPFESWEERSRLVNQYGETIHGSGMNPIRRYRRREDTLGIDTIPAVVFFVIMIERFWHRKKKDTYILEK